MAIGGEVLTMLCPTIEWTIYGDDYESIIWHKGIIGITKEEFEAGFAQYDAWKAEQDAEAAAKKAAAEAKLAALGLTSDDLKALGLGGN
jgi:hypothetical protein